MLRDGKPKGYFYLDNVTVDNKMNMITDVHITAGNVNDASVYLERLDYQKKRFNFNVEEISLDAGYSTASIFKGLEDRNIFAAIAYRRPNGIKGLF